MATSKPTTNEINAARAQFVADVAARRVPEQSTTDGTKAAAFVAYINSLTPGKPTVELITKTTYSIKPLQ